MTSRPVGRPVTEPCGSEAAYKRAKRREKQGKDHCGPCEPCKAAWAEAQRRYYAKRKGLGVDSKQ